VTDGCEIRRIYFQIGKIDCVTETFSVNEKFCKESGFAFGDKDSFNSKGGWSGLNTALGTSMTLVLSLWDDHLAKILWLDSTYSTKDCSSWPLRNLDWCSRRR
jgi:cellulose 1,4-beta-cellobiosidase